MSRAVKQATTASKLTNNSAFHFPTNTHLIITTPGGIYSWDHDGVKKVFSSSKKGILAAKEATDGSQVLAVADKHVVVMHDCKRGREQSWGLNGSEGVVRLLEYAPDANSLFMSTSATGAIQHYCVHESRLLDSPSNHPSPPTVLAISPTSHLMLSASEDPVVVYLQNLTLKTPAIQLHPSASNAAVVTASFHPKRPNIFLLAFKDGTIAAYDATKIVRSDGKSCHLNNGCGGEISHFSNLHRITNVRDACDPPDASPNTIVGAKSVAITDAAFLSGFRTRAISVGADGRCRLIDFEAGGRILRTWHAQAPVTSLSVMAAEPDANTATTRTMKKTISRHKAGTTGAPTDTNIIIAVGRVDGQVLLFDSLGLCLDQIVIDGLGDKVISVEWMKGSSPPAIPSTFHPTSAREDLDCKSMPRAYMTEKHSEATLPDALKLPPRAVFAPVQTVTAVTVPFSNAEEVLTVRHTPIANPAIRSPALETTYLDLFSPVKKVSPPHKARKIPVAPPNLSRPRVSSQTFIRSSSPESTSRDQEHTEATVQTPNQLSIHPINTAISSTQKSPVDARPSPSARRGPRSARKRAHGRVTHDSSLANRNGKLLADLRKLDAGNSGRAKRNGNVALFAPYMNRTGISDLQRMKAQSPQLVGEQETGCVQTLESGPRAHNGRPEQTDLKVRFESESHSSDRDIWMSAGSSEDECNQRKNNKHTHYHARHKKSGNSSQSSHARISQIPAPDSTPFVPASEFSAQIAPLSPHPHVAGKEPAVLSMSEEAMYSAVSHLSNLDGEFVPASREVQNLFPRGSSVYSTSPSHQSPRRSPRRKVQVWDDGTSKIKRVSDGIQHVKLTNAQSNAFVKTTSRDSAAKKATAVLLGCEGTREIKALPPLPSGQTVQSSGCECSGKSCQGCLELGTRVRSLEDEVARLKAEVLGLRSALRRTGVSSRMVGTKR